MSRLKCLQVVARSGVEQETIVGTDLDPSLDPRIQPSSAIACIMVRKLFFLLIHVALIMRYEGIQGSVTSRLRIYPI